MLAAAGACATSDGEKLAPEADADPGVVPTTDGGAGEEEASATDAPIGPTTDGARRRCRIRI
jgi:hypothetical protein